MADGAAPTRSSDRPHTGAAAAAPVAAEPVPPSPTAAPVTAVEAGEYDPAADDDQAVAAPVNADPASPAEQPVASPRRLSRRVGVDTKGQAGLSLQEPYVAVGAEHGGRRMPDVGQGHRSSLRIDYQEQDRGHHAGA